MSPLVQERFLPWLLHSTYSEIGCGPARSWSPKDAKNLNDGVDRIKWANFKEEWRRLSDLCRDSSDIFIGTRRQEGDH
uniref:Uncharacterized protein n=1 Tax=Steinernema glaseri TaxID=37863 RepID=A0A1I7ZWT9_9BILA